MARWPSGYRVGLRRTRARVQIAVATLSGNSLRQTAHTRRAYVHQAAKLVAARLRVAGGLQAWPKVMAAYRRVYDFMTHVTCRLTVKNRDPLRNPTLGNRVWATFFTVTNLALWLLETNKVNLFTHCLTMIPTLWPRLSPPTKVHQY